MVANQTGEGQEGDFMFVQCREDMKGNEPTTRGLTDTTHPFRLSH